MNTINTTGIMPPTVKNMNVTTGPWTNSSITINPNGNIFRQGGSYSTIHNSFPIYDSTIIESLLETFNIELIPSQVSKLAEYLSSDDKATRMIGASLFKHMIENGR